MILFMDLCISNLPYIREWTDLDHEYGFLNVLFNYREVSSILVKVCHIFSMKILA